MEEIPEKKLGKEFWEKRSRRISGKFGKEFRKEFLEESQKRRPKKNLHTNSVKLLTILEQLNTAKIDCLPFAHVFESWCREL